MLGIMRKYKQSILIKGIFIVIVLSFIGTIFLIWGKGGDGLKGSDYAAKVDRTKISYDEFQQTYSRLREMYQQISGQPLTPELEKQLGLKKMALENLINTTLMLNEAKRMDITVSKEEVVNAIATIPAFQKDGAFYYPIYQQLLQSKRLTPQYFEEKEKEELLLQKVRRKVVEQAKVSDADALALFSKQHDKINLLYASFSPADVKAEVKLSTDELQGFLQNHQEQFRTPEQISISYVLLTPEKAAAGLTVSNEEMLSYYRKNIDRYQGKGSILPFEEVKDRVKADALRFKASGQAYEKAANALNRNLKTADLKGAARMLGLAIEKTLLFTANQPPRAIASERELIQKAFTLKPGELGGPVETSKGVYLLMVNERKPAAVPPLTQIRARVEQLAAEDKARALAQRKAELLLEQLGKKKATHPMQETGLFLYSEKGDIPKIGKAPQIMETAFTLSMAAPTPKAPIKIDNRWYVIMLKERIAANNADFQKVKEQLKLSLLPGKQQQAFQSWLKGLRAKAKIEINPILLAD